MARRATPLTTRQVATAKAGVYGDGNGLFLVVKEGGSRAWEVRYQLPGAKRRSMGIGGVDRPHSLAEARDKAREIQKAAKLGIDPLAERQQEREAAKTEAGKVGDATFRACAEAYIASRRATWKSAQHAKDWEASLKNHVYPLLADVPVQNITALDVLAVLQPIWLTIPETASRVRNRMELAIDWGIAMGHRPDNNPARWAGKVKMLLPSPTKAVEAERLASGRQEHLEALPWRELPTLISRLRECQSQTARALEFTILTVARTNMTRAAEWSEIDFQARTWTVPAIRMKMSKAHCIPLTDRAIDILTQQKEYSEHSRTPFIFPGVVPKRPIHPNTMYTFLKKYMQCDDITVHGFRSTFRQWVADKRLSRDAAEMALAHTLGKVEGAYQRSDLLDERRVLAEAWDRFISGETSTVLAFPTR